jgi:hypothetical protein
MNHELETYARNWLKENLARLSEGNHSLFKRMYGFKKGMTADEVINQDLNAVVDLMPSEELDWAMQQVKNTKAKQEVTL